VVPTNVASQSSTPATVELFDGTKLTGELQSTGRLSVVTIFGSVDIPVEVIRGLSRRYANDDQATLKLTNDDSLTVTVGAPHVQVKTAWGVAVVELGHVKAVTFGAAGSMAEDNGQQLPAVPKDQPAGEIGVKH
jgi:hypothetical protein